MLPRLKLEIRGAADCMSHVSLVAPTCHCLPALQTSADGHACWLWALLLPLLLLTSSDAVKPAETQLARAWHAKDPPRIHAAARGCTASSSDGGIPTGPESSPAKLILVWPGAFPVPLSGCFATVEVNDGARKILTVNLPPFYRVLRLWVVKTSRIRNSNELATR